MVLIYQRADAATDDVGWNDNIEGAAIGSQVSLILEYESRDGAGPRLHRHPYTETFVVRHGRALFTVGDERLEASGGQVLVVPAFMPPIPAAELHEIAVPTTLIWGREDLHVPLAVAETAHRRYGWPLHVIDDAGDDPPIEQPQAFLAALHAAIATQTERETA